METPPDVSEQQTAEAGGAVRAGRGTRVLWGLVFFFAGLLLLGILTLASASIITPQFFVEPCQRTELVVPANCVSGAGAGAPIDR